MAKGQIIGQIFIYISAAVVIGVIILLGYQSINGLMQKKCAVEQVQFKNDLEAAINRFNSFGSVTRKDMSAPCNYDMLCLVSTDAPSKSMGRFSCTNKIIEESYDPSAKQNIFVVTRGKTVPIGYSAVLTTNKIDECTCITQKNGVFPLLFLGQGSKTNVTTN